MGVTMGCFRLEKKQDRIWEIMESDGLKQEIPKFALCSQKNKRIEIDNILEKIDFKYHTNFIIFGIKNIELISQIYNNKTPFSTMTIIEIENNDIVELEWEEGQLKFLNDKTVDILIGKDDDLTSQIKSSFSKTLKLYNLGNMQIISMPYVKSTYPQELELLIRIILESLSTNISAFGNDIQDILIGMDNYINNWQYTFRAIEHIYFENLYKGKPAIIVGAGPSVDKSIEYIKKAKGRALILCVDAAMDVLLDEGIVPDIVASIERTDCTVRLYQREYIPQEIVYVGANQVPEAILGRMERIIFTGRIGDALFREFNESIGLSNLNIGNNVSHILVSFAQFLGCSTVIFTGLDLAYPQGVTHAKRTLDNFTDTMKAGYKHDMVFVKGQRGEILETQEYFMHTRVWIEDFILENKNCSYINSSEGGANISGAKNLNIADAIKQYCTDTELLPISKYYDEIHSKYKINKKITTKKAIDFFNSLIKYYDEIYNISKKNYNVLSAKNETGILKLMEEQRYSMGEKLAESLAGYFIIQSILIKYNRDIHSFPMCLEKEDEIRMKKLNMDFYDLIKKVTKRVNKDLNLYIKSLKSHLEIYNKEGEN